MGSISRAYSVCWPVKASGARNEAAVSQDTVFPVANRMSLGQQSFHDFSLPVLCHVERSALDDIRPIRWDSHDAVNRRVQVLNRNRLVDNLARAIVRRAPVDLAFLD